MGDLRERILSEIKRVAQANGGKAPGRAAFAQATGIKYSHWSGSLWARWGDALAEAGYAPNKLNERRNSAEILTRIIAAVRHYRKVPTFAELELYRRHDPGMPKANTINAHFSSDELVRALRRRALEDASCSDIAEFIPPEVPEGQPEKATTGGRDDGWVYLIKSGDHYKIGRGDNLERRVKEIKVALPEVGSLVHAIRTDDPSGIEAYWHRRFADRRANGEWFRLSHQEVAAFKRRRFQ